MKLAKKISKGIALLAALTIIGLGGVLTSCSNNSSDNTKAEEEPTPLNLSAKTITFSVTEDSTNDENTMLIFQYARSAAGAKELVKIEDCGITVKLNDDEIKAISTLEFALDEYGASFSEDDADPIKDANNMKEYKAKVSLGKKVAKGDKVVVYYNEGVRKLYGEGKDSDAVKSLLVALIDTDEAVDYYKPLVANDNNYQPFFEEKKETDGAGPGPEQTAGGSQTGGTETGGGTTGGSTTGSGSGTGGNGGSDNQESGQDPETPKETVLYKLDFSGEELPDYDYNNIEDANGKVEFKANEGVSITEGWNYFAIVPKGISEKDFISTANYIKVTFKCSDGATFEDSNNRFMVAVYNTDESYADTNFSWTAFFDKGNDGDIPTKFETLEKEINWEQKAPENLPLADTTKINGIRIWTQAFTGTLTIQSVEFIKK